MQFRYQIQGGDFNTAGNASSAVKKVLKQLNVDATVAKRTVVALYEAEVNIVAHAWSGIISVNINTEQIRIFLEDKGPGIPDIERAMQAGFTTASQQVREMGFGAGMGLPNIKKNTDFLRITSSENVGTNVEMIIYLSRNGSAGI